MGEKVCFMFNSQKGCNRVQRGGTGCDDGKGGMFAHVCNYEASQGKFCLARHPRHGNL
jgi:hypothetical protein